MFFEKILMGKAKSPS